MAAIVSLPPEILRAIFLYFQIEDRKDFPWKSKAVRAKPLSEEIISSLAVCKQWRSIIIDTSHLWARIICRLPDDCDRTTLSTYLSLLDVFIERSGSMDIDVFICIFIRDPELYAEMWRFLMQKAPFYRWRSLDLCFNVPEPLDAQSPNFPLYGKFDVLESLIYTGFGEGQISPLLRLIDLTAHDLRHGSFHQNINNDILREYPSMMSRISSIACRSLDFSLPSNITRLRSVHTPQVPLPHVINLTIESLDLSRFTSPLFPRVEKLEITHNLAPWGCRSVEMPTVRHLMINSASFNLIKLIICPWLETLSLSLVHGQSDFDSWFDLGAGICSDRYSLSPVTLNLDLQLDSDTLLQILQASPRLENLHLQSDEQLLEWLNSSLSEKLNPYSESVGSTNATWKLCPALHTLQFKIMRDQTNTEGWRNLLLEILDSRAGNLLKSAACVWEDGNKLVVAV